MSSQTIHAEIKHSNNDSNQGSTFLPRPKKLKQPVVISNKQTPKKLNMAPPKPHLTISGGATLTVPWKQRARTATTNGPGTVGQLKPGIAVAVLIKQEARVSDAVQSMAERRTDCVLVTDADGLLCGILTDKDIVYKVVAQGLNPRSVSVREMMTKNPKAVSENTLLTDALSMMVAGKFRHLPVTLSDDEEIARSGTNVGGILDIVKCTWEALNKLDKVLEGSKKLQDALDIFQNDIGGNNPVEAAQSKLRALAEKLSNDATMTTLHQAIFERGLDYPPVPYATKIKDIAVLLQKYHTTGILVKDATTLKGIFTTKDVVFKVLKNGMDPSTTSVVRFMTKSPVTIGSDQTVLDALRKMHQGGYFHLPVVDHLSDGEIVGIVNVLQLTYYVTKQLPSILGQSDSGKHHLISQLMSINTESLSASGTANDGDDSSSVASSALGGSSTGFSGNGGVMLPSHWTNRGSVSETVSHSATPFSFEVFNFKLRDTSTGQVYRFTSRTSTLKTLMLTVAEKLNILSTFSAEEEAGSHQPTSLQAAKKDSGLELIPDSENDFGAYDSLLSNMTVYYEDDEGDSVLLGNDHDLMEALQLAQRLGWNKISLIYQSDNPRATDVSLLSNESETKEISSKALTPLQIGAVAGLVTIAAIFTFKLFK